MRLFSCQHRLRSSGIACVVQQLLECGRELLCVPTPAVEQYFHICHLIHSMRRLWRWPNTPAAVTSRAGIRLLLENLLQRSVCLHRL